MPTAERPTAHASGSSGAYAQRDGGLPQMKGEPLLKSLEHDPRYALFLKKMHLPH